jgi:imidazolonepropionase-like amidohydrolase
LKGSLAAFVATLVVALPGSAPSAQTGATPAASKVVAIKGATILTVTRGTIAGGTIVLRDGKIAAVGGEVAIPPGAEVIDAAGRFVSPGIVDCHSHMAADSIATINESGTAVSSMVGIEDVLNPTDVTLYRAIAGGVTTANVLHGSENPIGGKNAVIKLRWGRRRGEELLFRGAMPGIKFALGENIKAGASRPPRRFPATRPGIEYVIRDAFTRAKAYQREWQDYEAWRRAGRDVVPPRRDLQLEPLVEVLEGKRLVHAHCYRADEILMLIRLAEEMGFKVATFQHVLEGYKVAREIAAHGAGASTFADWWGFKVETMDGIPYNAALMTRKGVLVSINSDLSEWSRRLNTEAAKTIKWGGLSDDEALALITINPARQLRIDQRVGSLEVGKDADVVIWSHHPLSSYALADRVYIDGALYYDREADARRLADLQAEKESLVKAERGERPERPVPPPMVPANAAQPIADGSVASAGPTRRRVDGGTLAIVNARIHPVTNPEVERGTILVRNGLVAEVGTNVSVPAGTATIDASGADVYPGWINARSTLGLAEPGPSGYADTDELLDFNPPLRSIVAFHNDSDAIPIARANGVTTVAVTPSGGILGGEIAVMNLDGWTWEESEVSRVAGLAFSFPTLAPPRPPAGGRPEAEKSYDDIKEERDAKLDALARLLDRARAYAKAGAARDPRQTDLVLEALVPVVARRLPLITRVDREADIRDAVAFADQVGVRIVISGGIEAPLVAPLLKARGIPVILGPVLQLPSREDSSHASSYQAAAELHRAGIKLAFATGDANYVRLLPYHAARAVAWGLPHAEAIKALTINAAEILGVGARLGSIEPGKMANLVIVKGDPLEIRTEVLHVVINGRDVGLDNRQLALYERYRNRE